MVNRSGNTKATSEQALELKHYREGDAMAANRDDQRRLSEKKKSNTLLQINKINWSMDQSKRHRQNSDYGSLRTHNVQPLLADKNSNARTPRPAPDVTSPTQQGEREPSPQELNKLLSLEELMYQNHQPQQRPVFSYQPKMESVLVCRKKKNPAVTCITKGITNEIINFKRKKDENSSFQHTAPEQDPSARGKKKNNTPVFCQSSMNRKQGTHNWQAVTKNDGDVLSPKKQRSDNGAVQAWDTLDPAAMTGGDPMTPWTAPGERRLTPPPIELLRCQKPISDCEQERLWREGLRQKHALEQYERAQVERMRVENYVLSKINRPRGHTMMRKNQCLPKVTADGHEKDVWLEKRTQTPDKFPDWGFFKQPLHSRRHDDLTSQVSREDRGYDVVLDLAGKPVVTDEQIRALEASESLYQSEDSESWASKESAAHVVCELGVRGRGYVEAQALLREERSAGCPLLDLPNVIDDSGGSFRHNKSKPKVAKTESSRTAKSINSIVSDSEYPDESETSYVGLKFGDANLSYSLDPERAKQKWIVEVGCSAEVGEKSLSHVFLENTGTTAIHYSWVKVPRDDPLATHRHQQERFIFDDWGGTILPGEVYRAPVMYKSTTTGYFSQDWRLMTQPVLECGAHVVLRMWGVSRQYDPYFLSKDKVDEVIKARIPLNIVSHRVAKIFDYAPLREDSYKDTRFPLITLGCELFKFHNPFLNYHSAAVYRLGKLYEILQCRAVERETLRSPWLLLAAHVPKTTADESEFEEEEYEAEECEEENIFSLPACTSTSSLFDVTVDFSKLPPNSDPQTVINYATSVIRGIIDLDRQHLKDTKALRDAKYVKEEHSDDDVSSKEGIPPAPINLVNPEFKVDKLRSLILADSGITEMREAFFTVYAREVDALLFKPPPCCEDWPRVMARGVLVQLFDEFMDYAEGLKCVCVDAEERCQLQERRLEEERQRPTHDTTSTNSSNSLKDTEDPPVVNETSSRKKSRRTSMKRGQTNKSTNADNDNTRKGTLAKLQDQSVPVSALNNWMLVSQTISQEISFPKTFRDIVSSSRYQHQYVEQLHTRMHQMLAAAVQRMDELWSTRPAPAAALDVRDLTFKRVRDVQMPVNIHNLLEAPLPPKWLSIAEKLKDAEDRSRHRSVGLDCLWALSKAPQHTASDVVSCMSTSSDRVT